MSRVLIAEGKTKDEFMACMDKLWVEMEKISLDNVSGFTFEVGEAITVHIKAFGDKNE